jgi:ATP-dependent DNA helicase RecG
VYAPGRRPVYTQVLSKQQRRKAYETMVHAVAEGRRAFVVCPIIEEGSNDYLESAESVYERLCAQVPSLRWGLVHGRLRKEERERTMEQFRRGQLDALVATSVVEVGVDVPEAAMMIVENADRFGLAQLHQLRGRVARAKDPALCFLITLSQNPEVIERLQILERTNDGFVIAQEDLLRRGPGELLGERQHGYVDLRLAFAASDTRLLTQAREDAFDLLDSDPELSAESHQALATFLRRLEARSGEWTL